MRATVAVLVALSTVVALVGAVPLAGGADAGAAPSTAQAGTAGTVPLSAQQATGQCEEGSASYPIEVEDATNTTVRLEQRPERIVTLGPSAAQTMWELDAEDRVVGVSQFAAYLDGATEKANVSTGQFGVYDAEEIVSLEPDLVLAPNVVFDREVQRLREAGITVYKFERATSIEDIQEKTLLTGALVGECEGARETNRWVRENLDAVQGATEARERPRALYVSFGSTVGSGTFIHDMIEAAGATNVVADAGESGFIQQVNAELVAQQDPEWLVVTRPEPSLVDRAPYNSTTAVEEGNVAVVNVNYLSQPAPRSVVYAVRNMTEQFHGDAFGPEDYVSRQAAAQTPTPTTTTTTATATTDATTTATTEPDDGQAQPGLGAVVAIVAVLSALALLRRRD